MIIMETITALAIITGMTIMDIQAMETTASIVFIMDFPNFNKDLEMLKDFHVRELQMAMKWTKLDL
jgi:hypothetical protein